MGMSENRMLAIGTGLAKGYTNATKNLINITAAKDKLKTDKERSDLDFKIKKLQIKEAEYDTSPEVTDLRMSILKEEEKAKKSATNLAELKIRGKTVELEREQEQYATSGQMFQTLMDGMSRGSADPSLKWKYSADKGMSFEGGGKRDKVDTATNKALQGLSEDIADGRVTTKKEALASIEDNRTSMEFQGIDVGILVDRVNRLLPDEYTPAKEKGFFREGRPAKRVVGGKKEIQGEDGKWYPAPAELPKEIKKTSEAIKYLKKTYQMTEDEAKDWLRAESERE